MPEIPASMFSGLDAACALYTDGVISAKTLSGYMLEAACSRATEEHAAYMRLGGSVTIVVCLSSVELWVLGSPGEPVLVCELLLWRPRIAAIGAAAAVLNWVVGTRMVGHKWD